MDDTLTRLLAAESAARELVENAQKESEHLVQTALQEAHLQEERFEAWRLIGLVMAHHALGQASASDEALAKLETA